MDKAKRQQQLLEIVTKIEVNTQEELIKLLETQGVKVTQATVSRDIKELGLIKTSGKVKKYRYARVHDRQHDSVKLLSLFKTAVISIETAKNLLVVKTLTGNGGAVAATIDAQGIDEIVGTLAGDDTVLVVAATDESALKISEELHALLV